MNVSPQVVRLTQQLLQRQAVRKSLVKWAQTCGFEPARHHRLIIDKLEHVVRGEIERLMIFLPPGSAKSTYSSVLFPPWFLAQRPNSIILSCSHSGDLATSFGRKCRNLIESHELDLGFSLSKDSKAADNWATSHGCEYYCAGVGSGLSGRRADLGLIDDPIGKKEDAESKVIRDKQWNWWEFDFLPRLKPHAPVVLIQTRWHEDDLAGRIMAKEPGRWQIISVPLFAEENDALGRNPGEPLWPEWFTPTQYEDAKNSSAYDSLYQCRPAPATGDLIKWEWIEPALYYNISELPTNLRIYVGSDHALTTKEENDASCLIPAGVDSSDDIWILPDVWWNRADTADLVEAMLDIGERRKPIEWWAEDEHINKAIGPFLRKRMVERKVYFTVTGLTSYRDLVARSSSIRGRMKMCKVHLPAFADWFSKAKHEMLTFPVGTHDDFVAALSEIGRGLDQMSTPSPPPAVEEALINKPFRPTLGWLKELAKKAREAELSRYGDR